MRFTVLVLALAVLGACATAADPAPAVREGNAAAAPVSAPTARQRVAAGAALLDVRTTDEYAAAHIGGAINIPVDELAVRLAEVPADREVVVYCRSGRRSARAAAILGGAGREVFDLGPMTAW